MELNQKQKRLTRFIKSQFLKRAFTKLIILSLSVFSLFFSRSTLLSFLHCFNFYYFLTLPFKLLSHTLDKNCTFLLCNGLLVFLANYSGLFSLSSSSSSNKYNLNDLKSYGDDSQPKITIVETAHHQVSIPLLEQEAELENTRKQQIQNAMHHENGYKEREAVKAEDENSAEENPEEQEEEEEEEAVLEEDKDKAQAEAGSSFFIEEVVDEEGKEEEEEEEGGGGGNEKLSNEELNKKFDDFIRKMKEKLRTEARQ